MARHRFTILGCGASPGVPRINGDWGACDPREPRNRRSRCAALVERFGPDGVTRLLIDTGPDIRTQLIAASVRTVDAVVYTHAHADHVHGIDDLRTFWMDSGKPVPVHCDDATYGRLAEGFGYCFSTRPGSFYPAFLERHRIQPGKPLVLSGPGGAIACAPFEQKHGDLGSLGFRVGGVAYSCDLSDLPPDSIAALAGIECWVIGALRTQPHPSHLTVEQSLEWIDRIRPRRAILTHMTNELDYSALRRELPAHVEPAFDGMSFEFEA